MALDEKENLVTKENLENEEKIVEEFNNKNEKVENINEDKAKDLSKNEAENTSEEKELNTDDIVAEVKEKLDEELGTIDSNETANEVGESKSLKHQILKIFENLVCTIIVLLVLAFTAFTIINVDNSTISTGVSVLGVDVSDLNKADAISKVNQDIKERLSNNIVLKHGDFETNISPEQLECTFDVESAVNAAFDVGTGSNALSNSFKKILLIINHADIIPTVSINEEQLQTTLDDISTQLPDAVIQSTYYIEDNNLVITSGKSGVIVDSNSMKNTITQELANLSYINNPIDIATIAQDPEKLDVEQIYNEIHKDPKDAYYTTDPYVVYPEENGLDFKISLDEAKAMLETEQEEYVIPLQTLYPNVTTNMIGMEAFPDLLSEFTTKYQTSNRDRTTNLKLAAGKVNGTVLLPGETFSYNTVVGERTIAAGYKEAAIYQDGQVINGLGGGICQISTTLYNAALYSNLEIVERRNHQFVPSYANAGRDATVVYGSQDFKFKNNRSYAIKIVCSVDNGIAKFQIYGIREATDYEVVITSNVTSRTANSLTSATYKTLKQNGQVVSTETISRDTYKVH